MLAISRIRIKISFKFATPQIKNLTTMSVGASSFYMKRSRLTHHPCQSNGERASILNWAGKDGEFKRQTSTFRNWISNEPGAEFPPEKGRYHIYVSYACPWAHRVLIVRQLKGLEEFLPFTSVHWHMLEKGSFPPTLFAPLSTTKTRRTYRMAFRRAWRASPWRPHRT